MKWFYNRADKVLAVSGTVADILHTDLGVPKEKIETFYNTIDMQRYVTGPKEKTAARARLDLSDNDFIVLGNGQVQPRKRLDIFVKIFASTIPAQTGSEGKVITKNHCIYYSERPDIVFHSRFAVFVYDGLRRSERNSTLLIEFIITHIISESEIAQLRHQIVGCGMLLVNLCFQ